MTRFASPGAAAEIVRENVMSEHVPFGYADRDEHNTTHNHCKQPDLLDYGPCKQNEADTDACECCNFEGIQQQQRDEGYWSSRRWEPNFRDTA